MINIDEDKCVAWVKRQGYNLLPYQETILRAFCNGKVVSTARGIGRSFITHIFGQYIVNCIDEINKTKKPDIVITSEQAIKDGLVTREMYENLLNEFDVEYMS